MKEQMDDKKKQTTENGNTFLIAGGASAAYGTSMALAASYVCPVCVVAAPALLGLGAYQRYKYNKAHKQPQTNEVTTDFKEKEHAN